MPGIENAATPAVDQVRARLDEYLAVILRAGEQEQAVVGHGLNVAHARFIETFKSESAFRGAGEKAQHEFLVQLNGMVESLEPQHSGMSWGFRLFWMYARLMMESDPNVALHYAPELVRLGAKGKALRDSAQE